MTNIGALAADQSFEALRDAAQPALKRTKTGHQPVNASTAFLWNYNNNGGTPWGPRGGYDQSLNTGTQTYLRVAGLWYVAANLYHSDPSLTYANTNFELSLIRRNSAGTEQERVVGAGWRNSGGIAGVNVSYLAVASADDYIEVETRGWHSGGGGGLVMSSFIIVHKLTD